MASLLLLLLLGIVAMLVTVAHVQEKRITESTQARIALVRSLLRQTIAERSHSMVSMLHAVVQGERVSEALRRGDQAWLSSLAKELSPKSGDERMAFEIFAGDSRSRLLRVDADGLRPVQIPSASRLREDLRPGLRLESWGEPILKAEAPVESFGQIAGYVEVRRGVTQVLQGLERALGVRLFVFVNKSAIVRADWERVRKDSGDAGQSWECFPQTVLWGRHPPELIQALRNGMDDAGRDGVMTVEWSGQAFRGGLIGLEGVNGQPIGAVLALADTSALASDSHRTLWWTGIAAAGFGALVVVHLLVSIYPIKRRLFTAKRLLLDNNRQFQRELQSRTEEMVAINTQLLKEVDERAQIEQKLKKNHAFLVAILDSLAYPFIVVDARDFGVKLANKAATQPVHAVIAARSCFRLVYGRDQPCNGDMPCVLKEIDRRKQPVMVEHRLQGRGGEPVVHEVHAYPVLNAEGEVEQIIEYFIDITERRRAEDALSSSERNYRELVETTNSIVLRWDIQGVIQFINDFGARFFGYSNEDLVGRHVVGTIVPVMESGGRDLATMIENIVLRPADYQNNENENMRKDGERVWISWANKAILDPSGKVAEILSFGNDITQRRRAIDALGESEERFRRIFENSPVMMHAQDEFGRITRVNRKWEEETGYTQEEVVGRPLGFLMAVESTGRVAEQLFSQLRRQGYLRDVALQFVRKDEVVIDVLMDCSLSSDPKGRLVSMSVLQNVSERRRAEQEMQLAAAVFENSIEGILVTDARARILRTNKAFTSMTGYSAEEVLGRNPAFLGSGRHEEMFFKSMWNALSLNGFWHGEIWNRRKEGEVYPAWLGISTVYDERRQPIYYVGVFTDITDQKLSEQRIYHLAHYDALTDLPNRVLFQSRLEHALLAAKREVLPLPILYLDLDRFKPINDSFGHPVGDLLLQQVAERLRGCVRESDTIARMGGDEFTVILGDGHLNGSYDVVQACSHVANTVLEALAEPFDLEGHEVFISASIGIAVYPHDGADVAELVKNADTAMYHAKAKGRSNFLFYETHMNATAADRLLIENSLRRAIERAEFELYFQPAVNIRTRRVDSLEALIRWRHPDLGMVSPEQFVNIAEETGLIIPIGEWVLREAVRQAALWRQAGFTHLRVAVNLSLRQLRHRELMNVIRGVVFDAGLDASVLALEVTESAFMEDEDDTVARLTEISDMGIQILIDDFGTGYSSLARLRALPIQVLKIDRSFVRDITTDPDDASIISAMIAMAHNLQLKVIAEGVETESQLEFLRARECEEVQGYFFSKPIPSEEVIDVLRSGVAGACRNEKATEMKKWK